MRLSKEQMEALNDYRGSTPKPSDFEAFWQERIREADNTELHWEIRPSKIPDFPRTEYHELWFEGVHGEKMFAEYVRPVADQPVPLVLQFHGYPGRCRSFLEQSSFAGMGFALIAMDCPGQGGRSTDTGKYHGTTVSGHLIAGLDGPAKDMYYVRPGVIINDVQAEPLLVYGHLHIDLPITSKEEITACHRNDWRLLVI